MIALSVLLLLACLTPAFGTANKNESYGTSATVGDPISAASGAYSFRMPLLRLGGPMHLDFELIYRSGFESLVGEIDMPAAFWWAPNMCALYFGFATPTFSVTLPEGDHIAFIDPATNGVWRLMSAADGGFLPDNTSAVKYEMKETPTHFYFKDPMQNQVYIMQRNIEGGGVLSKVVYVLDRNDNQLTYTYAATSSMSPTSIVDNLGRSLSFEYVTPGSVKHLRTVTDQAGRAVRFLHEDQGADNSNQRTLRTVSNAVGDATSFVYQTNSFFVGNLVRRVIRPLGNIPVQQVFGPALAPTFPIPRVTSQTDAYSNTFTFSYTSSSNVVTVEEPDTSTWTYEHFSHHGLLKRITDPTNATFTYTKNSNEQYTVITDRLGGTTHMGYDTNSALLSVVTNARGDVLSYAYTSVTQQFSNPGNADVVEFTFHDLASITLPNGGTDLFSYDARGNVTNYTDPSGFAWRFTYDSTGHVLTVVNPESGVVSNTYNSAGLLASRTEPDIGTVTYAYDAANLVTSVTDVAGSVVSYTYDANGKVLSITDPRTNTISLVYDANGNLTQASAAPANITSYAYDLMDRLTNITTSIGTATRVEYDYAGRATNIVYAGSNITAYTHDSLGRLASVRGASGNAWIYSYNAEGFLTSVTDPMNHTWTLERDALGFMVGGTDPVGRHGGYRRDEMSRITSATNGLGQARQELKYDRRGLLTNITELVTGSAGYNRNGLGLIETVTDPMSNEWSLAYTSGGKLQSMTDPLGAAVQYSYDQVGQLTRITYPDNTVLTNQYDAAGNLVGVTHTDGTLLEYEYNEINQVTRAGDTDFSYDANRRLTNSLCVSVAFGAQYDGSDRINSLAYSNGNFSVLYDYDADGRLQRVADDLTGQELTFTYDAADQRIGIQRTNGVNATLTYNDNGDLTRIQDGAFLDVRYTLDAAIQTTNIQITAPVDPSQYIQSETNTFSYNNAAELTSAGYFYDTLGRLTNAPGLIYQWNGLSQLTGIGSTGLVYDALGRVQMRHVGVQTNRFFYNYAVGGDGIVAERDDASGQIQRYYVREPGGEILYMIDSADGNKVYYYHFDREGSTLALTDTNGVVTDAYAYTPYGLLLHRTGTNSQPFTYRGRFGVRQEDDSGRLYHMGARHYDALIAQFLHRAPSGLQVYMPRRINPYQYGLQNPVKEKQ